MNDFSGELSRHRRQQDQDRIAADARREEVRTRVARDQAERRNGKGTPLGLKLLPEDVKLATGFIDLMQGRNFPGAQTLWTEKPTPVRRTWIGKVLGLPDSVGGSSVLGYPIGCRIGTSQYVTKEYGSEAYICEDGRLRVGTPSLVENFGPNPFEAGAYVEFYTGNPDNPYGVSTLHREFRPTDLKSVLLSLADANVPRSR